jgi:hypothetical protein
MICLKYLDESGCCLQRLNNYRLLAVGKTKMQAIGAVMHKLLRIICGVLKLQQPFDPNRLCPP